MPETPIPARPAARDGFLPAENAAIYFREIGQGQPLVILHGGPDFDHHYLLPEMDGLAGDFRLIYYDQRGRGRSAAGVEPEDVTIESEIEDIERLRTHFQLETIAILGHSWGGLLALEYALRYPQRLSHLVLANTAPASHDDFLLFRQHRLQSAAGELEKMKALAASRPYQLGDPDTVAAYYRLHFRAALQQPRDVERVVQRLREGFTQEGILKARAIEQRLMEQTWLVSDYNLLPDLAQLRIPALVLHSDTDFIPLQLAAQVASAIPAASLVVLKDCGHFSYLEAPEAFRNAIYEFLQSA